MRMKRIFNLFTACVMVVLSVMAVACGDEEVTITQQPVIEEPVPPSGGTGNTDDDRYVYAAVNESINSIWVPRIYGPGNIPSEMTDGKKDSQIRSMFMDDDSNLYAAGWQMNSQRQMFALYWKNCSAVLLTDSTKSEFGVATGITTSGEDVYVSGYVGKVGNTLAVYWKNGEMIELSDGLTNAHTLAIFVSGSDVYVTGSVKNSKGVYEARLWMNGVEEKLKGTYASSVFVSGDAVYVAGDFGIGKYWKDGAYVSLGDTRGIGTSFIYVYQDNVYVTSEGKIWKNDSALDLTKVSNSPALYSLQVFKDDIYIGGSTRTGDKLTACYWKNGKQINITDGTNNASVASIAVVSTK